MPQVKVLLFGPLAEAFESSESIHAIKENITAKDLLEKLGLTEWKAKGLKCAVNQKFTTFDKILKEGDEIVFLTPVSGG